MDGDERGALLSVLRACKIDSHGEWRIEVERFCPRGLAVIEKKFILKQCL